MPVFFVYRDVTLEEQPRVFYVGKGSAHRVSERERDNAHWKNTVAKYGFRREVLLGTKDEGYAFDEERRLIREHHTFYGDPEYAWGANKTDGGDGVSGGHWTLSPKAAQRRRDWNRGRVRSQETKRRIGDATKRRSNDPAYRQLLSEKAKLRCQHNAEWCEKNAAARTGKKRSEATRQKLREAWIRRKNKTT